jgi:hypothetical protein
MSNKPISTLRISAVLFCVMALASSCQQVARSCTTEPVLREYVIELVRPESLPAVVSLRARPGQSAPVISGQSVGRGLLVSANESIESDPQDCKVEIRQQSIVLTAIVDGSEPVPLGVIQTSYQRDGAGGFSSLDQISLSRDVSSDWPLITVTQTALPAAGDQVFRPGPPVDRTYCFRDGAYLSDERCRPQR